MEAFTSRERHRAAGAAGELTTLAGLHLDIVNNRADRDVTQGHRIARLDGGIRTRANVIARLHALWREDVATLAAGILHESDVARTVRIVLEALDDAGDAVLVALEVDDAVLLTGATTVMPRGNAARMVARASLVLVRRQGLVRAAFVEVRAVDLDDRAGAGRCWLVLDESHVLFLTQ